jgi:hypothetical protein
MNCSVIILLIVLALSAKLVMMLNRFVNAQKLMSVHFVSSKSLISDNNKIVASGRHVRINLVDMEVIKVPPMDDETDDNATETQYYQVEVPDDDFLGSSNNGTDNRLNSVRWP